jgi:hypothetical protein
MTWNQARQGSVDLPVICDELRSKLRSSTLIRCVHRLVWWAQHNYASAQTRDPADVRVTRKTGLHVHDTPLYMT